jgi:murein DD-endopeptidase MepM/ murein hydrolase activator NlpD
VLGGLRKFACVQRRTRTIVAALSAATFFIGAFAVAATPAQATVASDRAQIHRLEQRIAADGDRVQELVTAYNTVQARVFALDAQIALDERTVTRDQKAEADDVRAMQPIAVEAYVTGVGVSSPMLSQFASTSTVTKMLAGDSYLAVLNGKLNDALDHFKFDAANTQTAQDVVQSERSREAKTLRQVGQARDAAQSAIASDEALLRHTNGNLRSLLKAAADAQAAKEAANERALAAAEAAAAPPPPPVVLSAPAQPIASTPDPSPTPSGGGGGGGGGYSNPLRGVSGLSANRIDQGVDYMGFGPIYAIGSGVVLSTVNGGWPGGTFIAYRLTSGPAAGLVVYNAEDIEPMVSVGQSVSSGTVLGHVYAGSTGIEVGWANPSADGDTMARTYGQYHGGNSTAFGYNFSRLLQSLGAPGGVLQNDPPTGSVPAGWPQW